ncbi:hypothetical protein jhhlp_007374 [Lomentospora prolificans]|uniref:Uncharacterized protein n=1 Tax=Lomentospora prolificans TaxID=41688 RepID=A0A2N3N2G3_9PEZI|nr:hypothetical protein jhhlp_007374 [Lomentospora prolificans]
MEARLAESWVEVASQPSSSSLSSIGDEIVTTGLHVAGSYPPRNRRRSYPARPSYSHMNPTFQAGGASSQEEYEASESEEDRNLASSTEQVSPAQFPPPPRFQQPIDSDSDSDDDDHATALGTRNPNDHVFRPQPNAFSNPPSTLGRRRHSSTTTVTSHPHSSVNRPHLAHRAQTRIHRGQPDVLSPSYQADNDAALRASLTTLLSCAAAARGLPKYKDEAERNRGSPGSAATGPSNQPMELRLVPESELMNDRQSTSQAARPAAPAQTRSAPSSPARSSSRGTSTPDKAKRGASAITRGTRASKKKRTAVADDALISPTLMTWVVSAGVVVLVSVVGFGAGYVIGREVGRQEVLSSAGTGFNASDTSNCGREVMHSSGGGLRRLRWGTAVGKTVVASS